MLLMLAMAATALASGLLLKCAAACRRKSSTSYSKSTNDLRGLESRERGEEEEEETTSEEEMARGHRQDQPHVVFLTVLAHFYPPYPRPTDPQNFTKKKYWQEKEDQLGRRLRTSDLSRTPFLQCWGSGSVCFWASRIRADPDPALVTESSLFS